MVQGTSLLLDNPLRDFVHSADLVTEVLHILLHERELFWPAPQASYRVGYCSYGLPHPAQEARTLFPVR